MAERPQPIARRPRIGITSGIKPGWDAGGRLWAPYRDAIEAAGGEPVWIGAATVPDLAPEAIDRLLNGLDGVLFSGGADLVPAEGVYADLPSKEDPGFEAAVEACHLESEPDRDAYELPLARRALEIDVPVYGICRGFQMMNVVCGGRLISDLRTGRRHRAYSERVSAAHLIRTAQDSHMEEWEGSGFTPINSRHHQGVAPDLVAPGLRATALAFDGVVEALEDPKRSWRFATQWHPERPEDRPVYERDRCIFRAFVDECRKR